MLLYINLNRGLCHRHGLTRCHRHMSTLLRNIQSFSDINIFSYFTPKIYIRHSRPSSIDYSLYVHNLFQLTRNCNLTYLGRILYGTSRLFDYSTILDFPRSKFDFLCSRSNTIQIQPFNHSFHSI